MRSFVAAAALLFSFAACDGEIAHPDPIDGPVGPSTPVVETPKPTEVERASSVPLPKGFEVPEQPMQLLPFKVRLSKLQSVVGAPASDPMFDQLVMARSVLGDYDFAAGVAPDTSWTALRISQWVTAIKPVCGSAQMKLKYPELPGNLGALLEAAYGRAATSEDRAGYEQALMGLTLSANERYEGICLAVLSSAEFVSL